MDKCKNCIHNSICTIHQQYYSITPDPHCGHYKPITDMISVESAKMGYSLFATYIFDEIEKRLEDIIVVANPDDCFITIFRKTMEKVTAEIDELKKKYTEERK